MKKFSWESLVGKEVRVQFWDHAKGDSSISLVECVAWGVVFKANGKSVRVCSWLTADGIDHNAEAVAVLKSSISVVYNLNPGKKPLLYRGNRKDILTMLRARR